jgi:hypothetical protein
MPTKIVWTLTVQRVNKRFVPRNLAGLPFSNLSSLQGAMSKNNDSSMDVDEAEIGQMVRSEISRGIFHSFTLSPLQGAMSIVGDNEDDHMDVDEAEVNQTVSSKISRRAL